MLPGMSPHHQCVVPCQRDRAEWYSTSFVCKRSQRNTRFRCQMYPSNPLYLVLRTLLTTYSLLRPCPVLPLTNLALLLLVWMKERKGDLGKCVETRQVYNCKRNFSCTPPFLPLAVWPLESWPEGNVVLGLKKFSNPGVGSTKLNGQKG